MARADMNGNDLFALMAALGWQSTNPHCSAGRSSLSNRRQCHPDGRIAQDQLGKALRIRLANSAYIYSDLRVAKAPETREDPVSDRDRSARRCHGLPNR